MPVGRTTLLDQRSPPCVLLPLLLAVMMTRFLFRDQLEREESRERIPCRWW